MPTFSPSPPLTPPCLGQLHLRPILPEDAERLMPIESVSFGRFHWSPDAFRNELANTMARYWLMEDPSTHIVWGYVGCWDILGEGHITTVAVHPLARGKGWGDVLISHALAYLFQQQVQSITLEVRITNLSAQSLYYKYGFSQVGKRPRYYQDTQEDALLLTFLPDEEGKKSLFEQRCYMAWQRNQHHWPSQHHVLFE
ncbi:MAG: ribosomal protein S18-alanine N-acetyltransferase [Vampirovibrionales bacterium]